MGDDDSAVDAGGWGDKLKKKQYTWTQCLLVRTWLSE